MSNKFFDELSVLDKIIQYFRFREVHSHIPANGVVVDFGAGDGAFLKSVAHRINKGFAFDRYADTRDSGNIHFISFDLDTDVLDTRVVTRADTVTALAVIEHVKSPEKLMKEAFSILRPGGVFFVTTPTPRSRWLLEFLAFRLGITEKEGLLEHRRYMWGYELYTLAKDIGFSTATWHEFEFGMNTIFTATK